MQFAPENRFAPPGSNRNDSGSDEAVGAFDGKVSGYANAVLGLTQCVSGAARESVQIAQREVLVYWWLDQEAADMPDADHRADKAATDDKF